METEILVELACRCPVMIKKVSKKLRFSKLSTDLSFITQIVIVEAIHQEKQPIKGDNSQIFRSIASLMM
jgi:hypothetical protein